MTKSRKKSNRRKKKAKRKRLLAAVISAVIIIILAFTASVFVIAGLSGNDRYLFGFRGYITLSGGMAPVIQKGSFLITRRVNPDAIQAGDIITYKEDSEIQTNRVVEIINDNGPISFITKGDANEGANSRAVPADNVIGRFVYAVRFIGGAMLALRNPAVMSFCVSGAALTIIAADMINTKVKKQRPRGKKRGRRYPQGGAGRKVARRRKSPPRRVSPPLRRKGIFSIIPPAEKSVKVLRVLVNPPGPLRL